MINAQTAKLQTVNEANQKVKCQMPIEIPGLVIRSPQTL